MDNLPLLPTLVLQYSKILFIFWFSALYLLCLQVCFVGKREETGMLGDDNKEKGAKRKKKEANKHGKKLTDDLDWTH